MQVAFATRKPASPASSRHVSSVVCDPSSRHVLPMHTSSDSAGSAAEAAAAKRGGARRLRAAQREATTQGIGALANRAAIATDVLSVRYIALLGRRARDWQRF
jgi:hypothetical protein